MLCLFTLLITTNALPNGAPRCQINVAGIARGMNEPDETLGYSLVVDKTGPGVWNIRVDHPSRVDYQGLLLYVTPENKDTNHLGSFTFQNATKWKFQPQELCTQNNVTQSERATVTHANPGRVPIARQVNFTWTGDGTPGPFVAQAVVASLDDGATGIPKWHKVENVVFGDAGPTRTNVISPTRINPSPTWNSASSFEFSGFLALLAFL
jgi:hypothetical protein